MMKNPCGNGTPYTNIPNNNNAINDTPNINSAFVQERSIPSLPPKNLLMLTNQFRKKNNKF